MTPPSARPPRSSPRRWPRPLILALLLLCAQAAILQSVARFASEVSSDRASSLAERRLVSQARLEAVKAASYHPYNGYALFRIGLSDFLSGSSPEIHEATAASFLRAFPYMPHLPNVLRALSEVRYRQGNYPEAATLLDRYFTMVPEPSTAADYLHLTRGLSQLRSGRTGQAAVELTVAGSYPENEKELLASRVLNALAMDQPLAAETILQSAAAQTPPLLPEPRQTQDLLNALASAGRLADFVEVLDRTVKTRGAGSPYAKHLVAALMRSGQTSRALQLLNQMREVTPSDPDLPLMLGDLYYKSGKLAEAREAYARYLQLQPDSPLRQELSRRVGASL